MKPSAASRRLLRFYPRENVCVHVINDTPSALI